MGIVSLSCVLKAMPPKPSEIIISMVREGQIHRGKSVWSDRGKDNNEGENMIRLTAACINSLIMIQMVCLIHVERAVKIKWGEMLGIDEIVHDCHSTCCWSCDVFLFPSNPLH